MSSLFPSDINECAMGIDGCDPRGSCVNTAGSFQCTCDSLTGFQLGSDQRTCVGTYACVLLCFTVHIHIFSSLLLLPPFFLSPCSSLPSSSLLLLPPFFLSPAPPSLLPHVSLFVCLHTTLSIRCQRVCTKHRQLPATV